jgi:serine/threonine protein kinase
LTATEELGRGAYGVVEKMEHTPSKTVMAVKRISCTVNTTEQKRLLMDLDINMRSGDCKYMVQFYGAMFREGDVWICMEVMDSSLDKFYRRVFKLEREFPEQYLVKIAISILQALHYLYAKLSVIHRDVKPSNILIDRQGRIKICDFGIRWMREEGDDSVEGKGGTRGVFQGVSILPKVSLGPGMLDHSTPWGWPPMKLPYGCFMCFRGGCLLGRRHMAILLPPWIPMPYAPVRN